MPLDLAPIEARAVAALAHENPAGFTVEQFTARVTAQMEADNMQGDPDTLFIVNALQDVFALLREVKRLRGERN